MESTHDSRHRLQRLHDAGVSIWLDTLSRDLLESGEFAALVDTHSVTGATSNPTIFAKAITRSDPYDEELRALASAGVTDTRELFFALALADVRHAAAILRPVHQRTDGRDGFISFQCTPDVADDAEATGRQALDLWQRLGLPNVLIKVPATRAGVDAIKQLTARARARGPNGLLRLVRGTAELHRVKARLARVHPAPPTGRLSRTSPQATTS